MTPITIFSDDIYVDRLCSPRYGFEKAGEETQRFGDYLLHDLADELKKLGDADYINFQGTRIIARNRCSGLIVAIRRGLNDHELKVIAEELSREQPDKQ